MLKSNVESECSFGHLLLQGLFNGCSPRDDKFVDVDCEPTGVGKGVDGYFGGVDEGVLNNDALVIRSKNASICRSDRALCKVSNGLIGGTPPNPSKPVKETRKNY